MSYTPKMNISTTPLRLGCARRFRPPETPDCYKKITVESPKNLAVHTTKEEYDKVRNLTVAVRIRPLNRRELSIAGCMNMVNLKDNTLFVKAGDTTSATIKTNYEFKYDHVFWSCDETNGSCSNQEDVFIKIGQPLLCNAFRGYNACLFAYGQTGSGKSYSMMGPDMCIINSNQNTGIIPRFCRDLFSRIEQLDPKCSATVEMSYFEIYNEKIHDLLLNNSMKDPCTPLKVREHPSWGPYVVNLSTHMVKSYDEMCSWLLLGNENRATAATVMNEKSSRSHSILSVELSIQNQLNDGGAGRRSKISLVDLAGSERLGSTCANDEKHKQGVSINKSLLTLGKVICALADQKKGQQFVPYRESVLTWLLRESLGGNSLTCMLATITPASTNQDETLATLRYACRARSIVNRARINEEPHDRLIRELRSEVKRLKSLSQEYEKNSLSLSCLQIDTSSEYEHELEELKQKLTTKEKELVEAQQIWENRYKETHQHQMEQLVKIQRTKEELESRVRIMSNLNDDISLSPYQTNFLSDVENILTDNQQNTAKSITVLENWFERIGFQYKLNECGTVLTIMDIENSRKVNCSVAEIMIIIENNDTDNFLSNLKWDDNKNLTELQVTTAMNDIYEVAKLLKPHINKEEKLRLVFAKFMKSAQALETALCNSIHVNKPKKVVTFRL